jgi:membrane protein YqaA with SNARE-associated domain
MIEAAIAWLFSVFAISEIGLTAVFVISFVSATLLPMGSEPAVFAMIRANPELFWLTILVATTGNTLGGMLNYFIGYEAKQTFAKERKSRWFGWLERYGAKTMLLAWLPVIGDPICALGGWLKLPALQCMLYMAIG